MQHSIGAAALRALGRLRGSPLAPALARQPQPAAPAIARLGGATHLSHTSGALHAPECPQFSARLVRTAALAVADEETIGQAARGRGRRKSSAESDPSADLPAFARHGSSSTSSSTTRRRSKPSRAEARRPSPPAGFAPAQIDAILDRVQDLKLYSKQSGRANWTPEEDRRTLEAVCQCG